MKNGRLREAGMSGFNYCRIAIILLLPMAIMAQDSANCPEFALPTDLSNCSLVAPSQISLPVLEGRGAKEICCRPKY